MMHGMKARRTATISITATLLLGIATGPGCATSKLWELDEGRYELADKDDIHVQAQVHPDADGTFVYLTGDRAVRCHPHLIYGEEAVALLQRDRSFEVTSTEVWLSTTQIDDGAPRYRGRIGIEGRWLPGWRTVLQARDVPPQALRALQQDGAQHHGLELALWQLGPLVASMPGDAWTEHSTADARVASFVIVDEDGVPAPQDRSPDRRGQNVPFTARAEIYAPWTVYLRVVDGDRTDYVRTTPTDLWLVGMTDWRRGHASFRTNFVEHPAAADQSDFADPDALADLPAVPARVHEARRHYRTPEVGVGKRLGQVALTPVAVFVDGLLFVPSRVLLLFADWN
jgi:hypothetical protein